MLARILCVALAAVSTAAIGQELRGKEASDFLAMASAKIKANCDAIKSWKGKIEANHDKYQVTATFAIAANGDVRVHVDEMSGHAIVSGGTRRIVERGEPNPQQMEFFVHGDIVDRVTFPLKPIPVGSTLPSRITTQVPKMKFEDNIRTTFLNPQLLFVDNGDMRMDEHLEITAQSALREDSMVVVSKPEGGDGMWTLKVQYKGSDPTAPRMQVTWRLDEAKSFLATFRSESVAGKQLGERAVAYELIGTVFLPKLVVETRTKRLMQFKVTTESLNEGPEKIEVNHRDNDVLTDVDGKHFRFLNGQFRPYDSDAKGIKK
jgi:hypothetical protein